MKAESQLDLSVFHPNLALEFIVRSFIDLLVKLVESNASEIKFPSQFVENAVAESVRNTNPYLGHRNKVYMFSPLGYLSNRGSALNSKLFTTVATTTTTTTMTTQTTS